MSKNNKYFQTFFSGIALSKDGVVRTKAIQDWAEQHKICGKRLVIDILNDMKELGMIEKARVKGMRKLEGWSIKEETEKTNNDIWISTLTKKGTKYETLTQKELKKQLRITIKQYEKDIANKKSPFYKGDLEFGFIHVHYVTMCLKQISRLTLAINSGLFLDKRIKYDLARENIKILEGFLKKILWNFLQHYKERPETYDTFIITMMDFFEGIDPFHDTELSMKNILSSSSTGKA